MMTLYRVKWCRCPTDHNLTQLTFIEAIDPAAARTIAVDHIERERRVEWYVIETITEYTPPSPDLGRVIEGYRE